MEQGNSYKDGKGKAQPGDNPGGRILMTCMKTDSVVVVMKLL